jgi:hypothetical protein
MNSVGLPAAESIVHARPAIGGRPLRGALARASGWSTTTLRTPVVIALRWTRAVPRFGRSVGVLPPQDQKLAQVLHRGTIEF